MRRHLRPIIQVFGSGQVTGAAVDDPSGIGIYRVVGATFGDANLWLAPVVLPLVTAVQFTCARCGLISGIAAVVKCAAAFGLLLP